METAVELRCFTATASLSDTIGSKAGIRVPNYLAGVLGVSETTCPNFSPSRRRGLSLG